MDERLAVLLLDVESITPAVHGAPGHPVALAGHVALDLRWVEPVGDIWTRSAQPWVAMSEQRLQTEQQPMDYAPFIERFRRQNRFPS